KLEAKGYRRQQQLILTTNYDDLLECAFKEAGEEYDVLSYIADKSPIETQESVEKRKTSRFRYIPYDVDPDLVKHPNEFLPVPGRTIILKIHGAIDRSGWEHSSFVITEDDYLDYLSHMNSDEIYK